MTAPLPAAAGPGRNRWPDGIPLGRLGGIRIVLSWSWLLSVVVITVLAVPVVRRVVPGGLDLTAAILVGVLLAILLGISVLVHELGHCLAARLLGLPVLQVRLYLLGGVSELGRSPSSPREESVIAAAGPALSAVLGGLFFLLLGSTDKLSVGWLLLLQLALSNGIIAVFNLLPALPLDGGRVLRAGVWRLVGRRRAGTTAAVYGGYLVAAALLIWGLWTFSQGATADLLQGGIAVATAIFVAAGAGAEHRWERGMRWPEGLPLSRLADPVVQLPTLTPITLALQAAGNRAIILTGPDGVAAGLVDPAAAIALLRTAPQAPADQAAMKLDPQQIALPDDDPADLLARARTSPWPVFLLVDADGRAAGVLPVQRLGWALTEHSGG